MKILDATCSARSIWYQKTHPYVTYMDIRKENIVSRESYMGKIAKKIWNIQPDIVGDFRSTPFEDEIFDMVIFDPPHIIKKKITKPSIMDKKYGFLLENEYKQVLKQGFKELFRILKTDGVLIFKWAETSKNIAEVLEYSPYKPLFGTRTGQRNNNHWIVFLKHTNNGKLSDYNVRNGGI